MTDLATGKSDREIRKNKKTQFFKLKIQLAMKDVTCKVKCSVSLNVFRSTVNEIRVSSDDTIFRVRSVKWRKSRLHLVTTARFVKCDTSACANFTSCEAHISNIGDYHSLL